MNEKGDRSSVNEGLVLDRGRETIGTTALDAEPDVILKMPGNTYTPLVVALGMTLFFVGLLLHSWWWAGLAALSILITSIVWLWPSRSLGQIDVSHD